MPNLYGMHLKLMFYKIVDSICVWCFIGMKVLPKSKKSE